MQASGSINPCGIAVLYDSTGKPIARTLDTPNNLAVGFRIFSEAVYALAYYPGLRPERREKAAYVNRCVDSETKSVLVKEIIEM